MKNNWGIVFAVILVFAASAWAENAIEATSYVPVPPDRLHANRGTIGSAYRPETIPDSSVPNGTLLVSGKVRVGPPSVPPAPSNGAAVGNIEVNDLFLRGPNLWASGLAGARMVAGYNSSQINVYYQELLLMRMTINTGGGSVAALGKVLVRYTGSSAGFNNVHFQVRLYRDGLLMDTGDGWISPYSYISATLWSDFVTLMKGEMALPAGSHTFELRMICLVDAVSSLPAAVYPGDARLTVMEM